MSFSGPPIETKEDISVATFIRSIDTLRSTVGDLRLVVMKLTKEVEELKKLREKET